VSQRVNSSQNFVLSSIYAYCLLAELSRLIVTAALFSGRGATDAMRHKTAHAYMYGYATHSKPQGYTSRPPLLTTNKVFLPWYSKNNFIGSW
jgi:hypothetical protein